MQIGEALHIAGQQLKTVDDNIPYSEARLLLAAALDKDITYVATHVNQIIEPEIAEKFFSLVQRRQKLEPIAYIIGKKEFFSREFLVTRDVLIPRPETEILIEAIIKNVPNNEELDILDLGTGSAVIAITLALELQKSHIIAVDRVQAALNIAASNVSKYGLSTQVELIQSNWYDKLNAQKFDCIVSNPPYISLQEKPLMSKETRLYEPDSALYSKDNGLLNYKKIIAESSRYLKQNGILALEIGFNQQEAVSDILRQHGLQIKQVYKDLQGISRVIVAA
jgi:release factor glutamine methyltransferase